MYGEIMQASLSKSPYPAFGLTVNRGDPARSDPTQPLGKVARYRSDLEVLYNSMSGCSTEDNVDAHGSEHGVVRLVLVCVAAIHTHMY